MRAAMLAGLGLLALQMALVLIAGPTESAAENWRSLYRWDGGWYAGVAEFGYSIPEPQTKENPGNAAFFPGYPMVVRAVIRTTGMHPPTAILLVAQLAAWGFWTYFLLLLARWNIPVAARAVVSLTLACHPAAFFMMAGYSESLFLFCLTGFLYWSERPGRIAAALAFVHGFGMTATRLVGIAAAIYPFLAKRNGPWIRSALIAAGACLGLASFFGYMQFAFGDWGAVAKSHEVGWNVHPDVFAAFRRKAWALDYGRIHRSWTDPESLARFTFPLSILQFAGFGLLELWLYRTGRAANWRMRWPLYLLALAMFFMPVMSHGSRRMSSLFRFALVWHALLLLCAASLYADHPRWRSWWGYGILLIVAAVWLSIQWKMLRLYHTGVFVA